MTLEQKVIKALMKTNAQTLNDEYFEGAMLLASNILNKTKDEISELLYDGAENTENSDETLWNILKKHIGHNVEIVYYGDPENPADITLEDTDTNEVILDAELYTICAREDGR